MAGKSLVLYSYKRGSEITRFGFSISKKIGKAVVRNRIKRVLKEICRHNDQWFKEGYDYILVPKKESINKKYHELQEELFKLAGRQKKLDSVSRGNL